MTHKDALEILGLEADASLDEAKRAYRNLSLHYHPDRNPAPNASTMFRYIHDAWEYIQNDAKKQAAERVKKQARAKRRTEAENALQQARAKRARAKQAEAIRRAGNVKIAKILGSFGCAIVVMLTIILVIPAIQDSCGTADKPVGRSIEPPDWDDIFIDKSVESSKTYIDRGKAKADKGEYFEAISDYDMAIQLEPANAKSYHYRGRAKDGLEQHAAAIVDYDKAIGLNPAAAYLYSSRGWAKYRLGQHAAAIVDYDKAIGLDPDAAYLYSNRGRVKAGFGQQAAAIADLDTVVRLDPDAAYAYTYRGKVKADLGQHFAAITDYDTAIRLDPDAAYAYYYRGKVKADLGHKGQEGREDLEKALKLAEKMKDSNLHSAIKRQLEPRDAYWR